MAYRRDKLLVALGILSLLIGIIWSIALEIAWSTPQYPLSVAEIIAGVLITTAGVLLLYQKGKGVYYGALITSIAAAITFVFITPYWEDYITGAFCFIAAGVTYTRRESFEMKPLMARLFGIVRSYGRVKISELATQLSTTEADVELAILNLQSQGEQIRFEAETREAVYGGH